MENINSIIESINNSSSFEELKKLNILPEPDFDDGYYFVSYSHKDYKKVLIDIIKYKENGIKIWYDRGLEVGKSWIEDVCRKIDSFNCKGVIAYYSDDFRKSSACNNEMMQTAESNKSLMIIDISNNFNGELDALEFAPYSAEIEEKVFKIKCLPKPELYDFVIDKNFIIGKYAILIKVNDKNIEVANIPKYFYIGKSKYRVRMIGNNAFSNCVNLKEVYLPDGLAMVCEDAFYNCFSLKKVHLGKLYKMFGFLYVGSFRSCFTNCIALEDLNFLKTSKIKKRGFSVIAFQTAFRNCTSLKDITISKPFVFIDGSFLGCSGLEKVVFKDIAVIAPYQFANCVNLKEVRFENVKKMGFIQKYAFYNCDKLERLDLPDCATIITSYAFANMKSLKYIHIPKKLKSLALNAFENCENIKELYLPKHLRRIEVGANIFEEVTIASNKIKFTNGSFSIDQKIVEAFPNLKVLYCLKNNKYDMQGLLKIESDKAGFDKYIVEGKYE